MSIANDESVKYEADKATTIALLAVELALREVAAVLEWNPVVTSADLCNAFECVADRIAERNGTKIKEPTRE
jgi:hypothetical protein